MKEQMKTNLFTAVLGCLLLGAFLMSTTDNATSSAAIQAPILQGPPVSAPAAASVDDETPKIPFTFYLSLVTAFTNGASIDFNAMDPEEQSSIWDKMSKWGEEQ